MTSSNRVNAAGAVIPSMALGTGRLRGQVLFDAIHAALSCGYRHIDTAAKYGNEAQVGEAVASGVVQRSEVFITTKVLPRDRELEFLTDVEASLARLNVAYIDLLLIHWPNQRTALRPQIAALCQARRLGLTRHIGVSNFPARYIDSAAAFATEPIAVNQVERHPYLDQRVLAQVCARHGIALMAFCPLGRGALMEEPVVRGIAAHHGCSPAQVVLSWQLSMPMNIVAPSSSNPARIAENFRAFDVLLSGDEQGRISELARPDGRVVPGPEGFDWNGVPR